MCQACTIGAQYGQSAPKEPIKSLQLPTLPGQLVSQDIFTRHGKNFLVMVGHYSEWMVIHCCFNDNNSHRTIWHA